MTEIYIVVYVYLWYHVVCMVDIQIYLLLFSVS